MQGGLFLNVVISQGTAILELLSSEDEPLLIRWDPLLILDLGLHVVNCVGALNLQGDGFAGEGFHEDLHATPETEHQVEGGFLLDIVVSQGTAILELLSSEDEPLLIRWDPLLVLDLGLHVVNGVRALHLQGDCLSSQGLYEDLHATPETEHQVEGGFLLDVVISQGTAIFKLLSGEDEPLLIRWDPLFVLDLGLDVVDGVGALNLQGDGFAGQGLNKDLHTTPQTEHQVEGGFLLDVVVSQGTAILKLLSGEDEPLLVWWDTLLVLDLSLDVINGVGALNLQSDRLASQGLHKDLHATTETEHQVEGRFLLDVVVCQGTAILELLSGKDEPLLVWWDTLLVLNFRLNVINGVGALHLQGDGLAGQGLNKDLHTTTETEHQMKGGLLLDVVISQGAAVLQLLSSENKPLLVWWDSLLILNFRLHVINGVGTFHLQSDGLAGEGFHKDLHLERELMEELKRSV